jgi:hypothetical protein
MSAIVKTRQENGMPIGLSEAFEGGFAIGLLRYYLHII